TRALERALRARGVVDPGMSAIIQRLSHYFILALGLGLALENLGLNLATLFAASAIFGVALGFAMQNIAENFVSGLILLLERAIKPGDVLEVEGRVVVVERLGLRTTVARTRDEEEIILPNSTMVGSAVKNYTLRDSLYRVRASVGVAYGSDMDRVANTLRGAGHDLEWRLKDRDPIVFLTDFGSSSVNFEMSVWMNDPWAAPRARSEMHFAIWNALKSAGITIAFPQMDVHFDSEVTDSLRQLPAAS
ncbi:MAG: mechanosensitive ion channel, partial [Longimicrobiales bacterium]|nr:mechanosensitive ion channel [Longimicrobiales bacterium]